MNWQTQILLLALMLVGPTRTANDIRPAPISVKVDMPKEFYIYRPQASRYADLPWAPIIGPDDDYAIAELQGLRKLADRLLFPPHGRRI